MQRIEAEFEIVTPMFLGRADSMTTAELRVPSIKGMLRFWWRALAWSRLNGDLRKIHAEEARIFGSAKSEVGQSTFQLVASWVHKPSLLSPPPGRPNQNPMTTNQQVQRSTTKKLHRLTINGQPDGPAIGEGARYLGYGLVEAFGRNKGKPPHSGNIVEIFAEAELSRPCLFHRLHDGPVARFKLIIIS